MPQFDVMRSHTTVHRVEAKSHEEAENKVDDMTEVQRRQSENREHFDHNTTSFDSVEVEDDDEDDSDDEE